MLFLVAPATKISFVMSIPLVIVSHAPVASFPVALKELRAIMMGHDPDSACIRWLGPIAFVPLIMAAVRVPIAFYPDELRAGNGRPRGNDAGWRRRANSDSDGDLPAK
jgi:hypothetical protein